MEETTPSFFDKIKALSFGQKITIGSLVLLLVALPAAVLLSLGPVDLNPKAGAPVSPPDPQPGTATLSIVPANHYAAPGSTFNLAVELDTSSQEVTAADVTINFPSTKFTVLEVLPGPFLPVELEETVIAPRGGEPMGSVRFVVGSRTDQTATGNGTIAIIKVKAGDLLETGEFYVNPDVTKITAVGIYDNILGNSYPSLITIQDVTSTALGITIAMEGVQTQNLSKEILYTLDDTSTDEVDIERAPLNVSSTVTENFSGTISSLKAGTHKLIIKGPVHLSKNFGNVVLTTGENVEDLTYNVLIAGDTDGNDVIDIFDYNDIVNDFGSRMPLGGSVADLDMDGDVDVFDYNIFVGNFGKAGDGL